MIEREAENCTYLMFPSLAAIPGLVHGVFTRRGGFSETPYAGLNLVTATGDDLERVVRNRDAAARALGFADVFAVKPVHGGDAVVIRRELVAELRAEYPETWGDELRVHLRKTPADAMITDAPDLPLLWAYGDCAPILLYDPAHTVIALIHAGWRGTAQAILPRTLATMRATYGTRPADVLAGIGPAIGACCYEVNRAVLDAFAEEPRAWESIVYEERQATSAEGDAAPAYYLDVRASNARQLRAAGVPSEHIEDCGICTGCRTDLFYSNRKEPKPNGRFGVALCLTDRNAPAQIADDWEALMRGGAHER